MKEIIDWLESNRNTIGWVAIFVTILLLGIGITGTNHQDIMPTY